MHDSPLKSGHGSLPLAQTALRLGSHGRTSELSSTRDCISLVESWTCDKDYILFIIIIFFNLIMNYNYNSRGALPPSALHHPENVFRLQHQSFKTSHLLNHKNYNSQSSTPLNKEGNISKIKYLESTVSQPMLLRRQDDEQSPIANEIKIYSNSIKFSQIAKNQQAIVHKSSRKLLEPLSFKKNVELFIPQTVTMN